MPAVWASPCPLKWRLGTRITEAAILMQAVADRARRFRAVSVQLHIFAGPTPSSLFGTDESEEAHPAHITMSS